MSKRDRIITLVGAIVIAFGIYGIKYYLDHRTVINGIHVPIMPNRKENNSTLHGVDTDHNGVRDDIDRMIAEAYGNDPVRYRLVFSYFKALTLAVENPTKENVRNVGYRVACILGPTYKDVTIIEHQYLETPEVGKAYSHAMAGAIADLTCIPE